jgi:phage shock protein PspC (stress-responsive transcriptional regulator)
MNKVLNINLGGLPFTIDDAAYHLLENYLQSLHNHFRASEGYEEIMNDIEARLAELMQEGMGKRGIATLQDVKNAVSVMGKPEDFGAEPVDESTTAKTAKNTDGTSRDNREGGKKSSSSTGGTPFQTGKRLFRDDEHKMVGGVCSGLSAYFGIDVVWLRIIWGLLFFFGGSGAVLYFILWAVVPSAKTTADRLAMKGQPIDVNNIAKTVETSFEKFSEKVNEFGKPENQERFQKQVQQFSSSVGNALQNIFKGLGGVGRVVVVILTIFAIIVILGLWIGGAVAASVASPLLSYVSDDGWRSSLMGFNVFAMLASVTTLLIFTICRMGYRRPVNGAIVGGVWTFFAINAACLGTMAGTFVKDFNHSQEITQRMTIPDVETLTISESPSPYGRVNINFGNLKVSDNYLVNDDVNLRVVKSDDGKFELVINKESDGRTEEQARSLVSQIKYDPSVEGDKIIFPHDFLIQKGQKWRNQHINMTLKVPVGKKIRYNREMRTVFGFDIDKDEDDDQEEKREKCYDSPVRLWVMTENGFRCAL